MKRQTQWEQRIQPAVEALGLELVGVEVSGRAQQPTLRVFIDHADGITVDHCAQVSRQIRSVLMVECPEIELGNLEVSSPGLDRPLFTLAHFEAQLGQQVHVKMSVPVADKRHFSGVLRAVSANSVSLEVEGALVELAFADIEKAKRIADI